MSEKTNEKKVIISGTVTKYQMKKVIKNPEDIKERKTMDQVSLEMFSWESQLSLLNMLNTKTNDELDKTNINIIKHYRFLDCRRSDGSSRIQRCVI